MTDPLLVGGIAFGIVFLLIILGVHIPLALALVGSMGVVIIVGDFGTAMTLLTTTPYHAVYSWQFIVLPLFVLMGLFALYGGMSGKAYFAASNWLGSLPAGLGIATTWACVLFGAACGSPVATASIFTKMSLPEMRTAGYDKKFSCGIIATSSMLSSLIPPSLLLVFYGVLTEQPIGTLLIAGILPGILAAVVLSAALLVMATMNRSLAPAKPSTIPLKTKLQSLRGIWMLVVLALIVLGGIYGGVYSPTEAAAAGAFGACVMALAQRRLNGRQLLVVLKETAEFTGMLFFIIIGAVIFARFTVLSGFVSSVINSLLGLEVHRMVSLAGLMVMYLFLGCFIDGIGIMAITMSIVFPVITGLGFDPIWFGIVLLAVLHIGHITPPFGLVTYVIKAAAGPDVSVEDIFRGNIPFIFVLLVFLVLLITFPQISLILPSIMVK